jgi:succinylglutamate desuccinylase
MPCKAKLGGKLFQKQLRLPSRRGAPARHKMAGNRFEPLPQAWHIRKSGASQPHKEHLLGTSLATLTVLESIPEGLLSRPATRLHEVLAGPTLIHLSGRRSAALYLSVLLHGNEDTGWEAVRALLIRYQQQTLPRALSVFIANVLAARFGLRHLEEQPDYNRIWKGGGTPEHRIVQQVFSSMRERGVFASVDVHNNTGMNPHYACVNRLEPAFLHLAALFSRTVVHFTTPDTVQSRAFANLCPAVTIEAGQPGQAHGVAHVLEFLDACLHLVELPKHPVAAGDIDLFHTVAIVKVAPQVSFSFDGREADLQLLDDLDRLNFHEVPTGTLFGWTRGDGELGLEVHNEEGVNVAERYFTGRGFELLTASPIIPSMLTLDERIVRQDCLCYLMERRHP